MVFPEKKTLKKAFYAVCGNRWLEALAAPYRGVLTILMYHRVLPAREAPEPDDPNACLVVTKDNFTAQMAYLAGNYTCLSLDRAVKDLRNGELPERAVCLTFDDGYRDNRLHALPVLEEYGLPATVYIATGFPDGTAALWWIDLAEALKAAGEFRFAWGGREWFFRSDTPMTRLRTFKTLRGMCIGLNGTDQAGLLGAIKSSVGFQGGLSPSELMLGWDEIKSLDRHELITIGAHTVSHAVLNQLSEEQALEEMTVSKRRLERLLGRGVEHFAYPFGSAAEAGIREFGLARRAGFTTAVTTRFAHVHKGHAGHLFAIPRIPAHNFELTRDFRVRLGGGEAFVRQRGRPFVTA